MTEMPFEVTDWYLDRNNRFPASDNGEQAFNGMLILLDCPCKQQRRSDSGTFNAGAKPAMIDKT
jgi:hypothetical protein